MVLDIIFAIQSPAQSSDAQLNAMTIFLQMDEIVTGTIAIQLESHPTTARRQTGAGMYLSMTGQNHRNLQSLPRESQADAAMRLAHFS